MEHSSWSSLEYRLTNEQFYCDSHVSLTSRSALPAHTNMSIVIQNQGIPVYHRKAIEQVYISEKGMYINKYLVWTVAVAQYTHSLRILLMSVPNNKDPVRK